jgi:hypothetical protein
MDYKSSGDIKGIRLLDKNNLHHEAIHNKNIMKHHNNCKVLVEEKNYYLSIGLREEIVVLLTLDHFPNKVIQANNKRAR